MLRTMLAMVLLLVAADKPLTVYEKNLRDFEFDGVGIGTTEEVIRKTKTIVPNKETEGAGTYETLTYESESKKYGKVLGTAIVYRGAVVRLETTWNQSKKVGGLGAIYQKKFGKDAFKSSDRFQTQQNVVWSFPAVSREVTYVEKVVPDIQGTVRKDDKLALRLTVTDIDGFGAAVMEHKSKSKTTKKK